MHGLRPAGEVLKTNDQPTKIIPPFCYDTGDGIFDPDSNCIMPYHNCKKVKISLDRDKFRKSIRISKTWIVINLF